MQKWERICTYPDCTQWHSVLYLLTLIKQVWMGLHSLPMQGSELLEEHNPQIELCVRDISFWNCLSHSCHKHFHARVTCVVGRHDRIPQILRISRSNFPVTTAWMLSFSCTCVVSVFFEFFLILLDQTWQGSGG